MHAESGRSLPHSNTSVPILNNRIYERVYEDVLALLISMQRVRDELWRFEQGDDGESLREA
jgi:hypothetical protein